MLNRRTILTLTILALLITGCKKQSYKGELSPGEGAVQTEDTNTFVPKNQNYTTMKAKVNLRVSTIDILSLKATVNVEVGNHLMISMQPLLGIEMFRVICNQDSIIFLDKFTGSYIAEPYKYFTDKNFNLNYEMIEGLLCNRYFDPIKESYKNLTIKEVEGDSVLHCQAPNYYVEFVVRGSINRTLFSTNDGTEYVMADYNQFAKEGEYTFPKAAVCTLSSKKLNFSANIEFEQVEFNEPVTIVTAIPSSYKKSKFESLIK